MGKSLNGLALKQVCLKGLNSDQLFFIYINDISDDLSTNAKLFADDTSLFSVVPNINTSATHLNSDLKKIGNWASQWKISFDPDIATKPRRLFSPVNSKK